MIKARVPPKRNSKEKVVHPHFHFTCAQVQLVNGLAIQFEKETLMMSVDNKNKVEVGIPATLRYTKIRTFHLLEDAPNYNDHDFPNANCKLVPSGYEILRFKIRSRSLSPKKTRHPEVRRRSFSESSTNLPNPKKTTTDKLGRAKFEWPRSGPLSVQLYSSRSIESTNLMHTEYLRKLMQEQRKLREVFNLIAIADGGPDWSVKGVGNLLSLGQLWKDTHLDCLIVQCYAPGHSRFNPIERMWSFLTSKIVTVILPDTIDGKRPGQNDDQGWLNVLDNAVNTCSKFWDGKQLNGLINF